MTRNDRCDSLGKDLQQPDRLRPVDQALAKLRDIVCQGLEHGFFECTVLGEIIQDRKRRLVIKAGNSFQFVIAADELGRIDRS
jgi:hypothetical protein